MVAIRLKNILPWVNHLVDRAVFLGHTQAIANRLDLAHKALREAQWDKTNLGELVKGLRSGEVEPPTAKAILQNFRLDWRFPNFSKVVALPLKAEPSRNEVRRLKARGIKEKFAHPFFAGSLLSRLPRGEFYDIEAQPPREYRYQPAAPYLSVEEIVKGVEVKLSGADLLLEDLMKVAARLMGKPSAQKKRRRENLFVLGDTAYEVLEERIRRHLEPFGWKVRSRDNDVLLHSRGFTPSFQCVFERPDTAESIRLGALQVLFESDLLGAYVTRMPPPFLHGVLILGRDRGSSVDSDDQESPARFLEFRASHRNIEVTTHIDLDRMIEILEESFHLGESSLIDCSRLAEFLEFLRTIAAMKSSEGEEEQESLSVSPFPVFGEEEWRSLFERSTLIFLRLGTDDFDDVSKMHLRHALNVAAPWQIQYGAELFLDSLNPRWIRDHPLIAE